MAVTIFLILVGLFLVVALVIFLYVSVRALDILENRTDREIRLKQDIATGHAREDLLAGFARRVLEADVHPHILKLAHKLDSDLQFFGGIKDKAHIQIIDQEIIYGTTNARQD